MNFFIAAATLGLMLCLSPKLHAFSAFSQETQNHDLRQQLQNDPSRRANLDGPVLWATDFRIFKQWGSLEYYHGPGYWIDGFGEYSPFEDLTVNGHLILQNGSTSYGYLTTSSIYALPSVTWRPRMWSDRRNLTLRFFDLGRMTVGTGLLIEDQEMSGFSAEFTLGENGWARFMFPGTSVINESGDLYAADIGFKPRPYWTYGLTSLYIYSFTRYDATADAYDVSHSGTRDWSPQLSAYARFNDHRTIAELEGGYRAGGFAGRVALGNDFSSSRFSSRVQMLGRYFDENYLGTVGGSAYTAYRPYSLYERTYNNPRIFLQTSFPRSKIVTASAEAHAKYWLDDRHFLELKGEAGEFVFSSRTEQYLWGKLVCGYSPYIGLPMNYIGVFMANYGMNMFDMLEDQQVQNPHALAKISGPNLGIEAAWRF